MNTFRPLCTYSHFEIFLPHLISYLHWLIEMETNQLLLVSACKLICVNQHLFFDFDEFLPCEMYKFQMFQWMKCSKPLSTQWPLVEFGAKRKSTIVAVKHRHLPLELSNLLMVENFSTRVISWNSANCSLICDGHVIFSQQRTKPIHRRSPWIRVETKCEEKENETKQYLFWVKYASRLLDIYSFLLGKNSFCFIFGLITFCASFESTKNTKVLALYRTTFSSSWKKNSIEIRNPDAVPLKT